MPSKVKETLLHLAYPSTKKEAESLIVLFGFWMKHPMPKNITLAYTVGDREDFRGLVAPVGESQ